MTLFFFFFNGREMREEEREHFSDQTANEVQLQDALQKNNSTGGQMAAVTSGAREVTSMETHPPLR